MPQKAAVLPPPAQADAELKNAARKIEDGERELADAKTELDDGAKQLADAEVFRIIPQLYTLCI